MAWLAITAIGCTTAPRAPRASAASVPDATARAPVAPAVHTATVAPQVALRPGPWWKDLAPGLYRRSTGTAVMASGRSTDHHHPAEGFLQAKVQARLAVRRAAGAIAFRAAMPEPYLEDLFITRDRKFFALYRLDVPGNAGIPARVADWAPPAHVRATGRRRIGRHMFEDSRHLYLECDIEGPIANPDWGQNRASAD